MAAPPQYATGWHNDPAAVAACVREIDATQACPAVFGDAHPVAADPDKPVLLWLAEDKVRGRRMPTWDQKSVGSCVSFGNGRAANDLIMQIASGGEIEAPAADVATEPIYGGSRVQVGGGKIRGDGSVGAWAAKWLRDWGVVLRGVYGTHDLTAYSEQAARQYGSQGCPKDLEPVAKLRPVKAVAQVQTAQQAWDALGSAYPVAVCSGRGFRESLSEGFLDPSGSWGHCMEVRGRVIARRGGKDAKAFVIQNSWYAGWLSGDHHFVDAKAGEKVELPEGCFLIEWSVMESMLNEGDSFAMSAIDGFPKREPETLSWLT